MAYAFDQINDLVDPSSNGGPQQSTADIFGGTPPSGGSPGSQSGQAPKTDASGDLGAAGASNPAAGSGGGKSSYSYAPDQASNSSAYTANASKMGVPDQFSKINDSIKSSQASLQSEADAYGKKQIADTQTYATPDTDVTAAVGGDKDAQGRVSKSLNQTTNNPYASFSPTAADTSGADAFTYAPTAYNRQGNIQAATKNVLQSQGDPNYTEGMANFDTSMLSSNPQFQALIDEINKNDTAYHKSLADLPGALDTRISDAGTANRTANQAALRTNLGGQATRITDAEAAAAKAANDKLTSDKAAGASSTDAAAHVAAQKDAVRQALNASRAGSGDRMLGSLSADPSGAVSWADPYTNADFTSADQANQFNNIQALLGGNTSQVASLGARPEYSIDDKNIYNQLMGSGQTALSSADTLDRQKMADINSGADARAKEANAARAGTPDQIRAALEAIKGTTDYQNAPNDNNPIDMSKYLHFQPGNLTAADMYRYDEPGQLNRLSEELGLPSGTYAQGGYNPNASPSTFDWAAYGKDRGTANDAYAKSQRDIAERAAAAASEHGAQNEYQNSISQPSPEAPEAGTGDVGGSSPGGTGIGIGGLGFGGGGFGDEGEGDSGDSGGSDGAGGDSGGGGDGGGFGLIDQLLKQRRSERN